jgi:CRP/FNR family transcriptional regulator, cyclic AMP receptor protein
MAKPKVLTPLQSAMAATALLREVAPGAIVRLSTLGTIRHYRRRTYLCHQGERADEVFFVVGGRIEASSVSANGSRIFHATIDTPQFVGELGPLGDLPRTASLLALDDSDIWVTDCDAFVDFLMSEPSAARAVIMALARQVQEHQGFVDDLLFLDLKGRVAKRLLQLVTTDLDALPADGVLAPEVTQSDLASLCGGSRENVTRILKEFERRGLLQREGHRYRLKKVAGLAKIADL